MTALPSTVTVVFGCAMAMLVILSKNPSYPFAFSGLVGDRTLLESRENGFHAESSSGYEHYSEHN